jgi:hypothetical protein
MKIRTASALFCLLFASALAFAEAAPTTESHGPRFVSLTFENDFFVGFDEHYTNGLQAAFVVDLDDLPEGLRKAPPFAFSADRDFVFAVGQRIFTPNDTLRDVPDPADRPYAGWLYLMADIRTRTGSTVDHLTTSIGVVDPASGARQAQNAVHRLTREDAARGWGHQIANQATVMVGYERAWSALVRGRFNARHYDLTPRAAVTVGNVLTHASTGPVLRYGSELPTDLPATHISLGPPRDGYRGTWFQCRAGAEALSRCPGKRASPEGGLASPSEEGWERYSGVGGDRARSARSGVLKRCPHQPFPDLRRSRSARRTRAASRLVISFAPSTTAFSRMASEMS